MYTICVLLPGPMNERSEPCDSCAQNLLLCPGHFGYIELPLPVVNPIFFNVIATILKMSCTVCFRVQIPGEWIWRNFLIRPLSLFSYSVSEALLGTTDETAKLLSGHRSVGRDGKISRTYIEIRIFRERSSGGTEHCYRVRKVGWWVLLMSKVVDCFAIFFWGLDESDQKDVLNKNTESLRYQFLGNITRKLKKKKKCMYCREPLPNIQTLKNRIYFSNFSR